MPYPLQGLNPNDTGCRRLKNITELDHPDIFFIKLDIFLNIFGNLLEFFEHFWEVLGLFWEHFGTFLEHFGNQFGKLLGSFGNIFGTILEEEMEKMKFYFFFELKNISVPEIFFN